MEKIVEEENLFIFSEELDLNEEYMNNSLVFELQIFFRSKIFLNSISDYF